MPKENKSWITIIWQNSGNKNENPQFKNKPSGLSAFLHWENINTVLQYWKDGLFKSRT